MFHTSESTIPARRTRAARIVHSLFAFGSLLCLSNALGAPVPALKFGFQDAPGTTTASSGSVNVSLTMFNAAGTATDLHGAPGSGVLGAINGRRCLDFTSAPNYGGTNGPSASVVSSTALGFGNVSNFTATMWFKEDFFQPALNGLLGRMFLLGAGTGATDINAPNTIGMKWQQPNQWNVSIGNDNPTATAVFGSNLPTNKWFFMGIVYDGTNVMIYQGSDSGSANLISTTAAAGATHIQNFGTVASLFVGNRNTKQRAFAGWMDDFRFYTNFAGSASFIEGVRQELAPLPTISGVYPDGSRLMQATNTFVFNVGAPSGVNISNVTLVLNGVNVSPQLQIVTNGTAGTSTNLSVTYTGLVTNNANNSAVITVADANGIGNSLTTTFDTFLPNNFVVEAEEFDFSNGQFIDNPSYTDGNTALEATSYFNRDSSEGVDTHKGASTGGNLSNYRLDDGLGHRPQTPVATGEKPWWKFDTLQDTNGTPIVGHMLANWSSAEWQDYTKTYPSGQYNIYVRASTASGSTITLDRVTAGQGTSSQTLSTLGQFNFSGTSLAGFQWVPLRDAFGQLAVVSIGGQNTLRLTTGGGANLDLFMMAPANTTLPTLSAVYPNGQVLFQSTNKLVFTVSSQVTTINSANIHLTLNGSNVSSGLVFTGGPSTWNVSYTGLQISQTYAAVITVTDNLGSTGGGSFTFDTWNPLFQVEAEDFDFDPTQSPVSNGTGKRYIDNAVPTAPGVAAANSYEGQIGVQGIDESGITAGQSSANYRPNDQVATSRVTDAARQQFITAGALDYNVGFLGSGFWQDYTRTWPAGTYNVYARLASGANIGTLHASWSAVLAGVGTTNQITRHIGSFSIPSTGGYSSYLYSPLIDRFGNIANLSLNGSNTFRVTELTLDQSDRLAPGAFGLNANFYMMVAPRTDLPRVDNVFPDGATLMQQTNTLSFVASSATYGVNTTNIQVVLNGSNISSGLSFSGSTPSWNVTYPGLQPGKAYTAVITVTDNTNQVHTTTVSFDTFNANSFTWEAEDWDFNPSASPASNGSGLRFIDNPVPTSSPATNSYFGQVGVLGTDYANVFGDAAPGTYIYRASDYVSAEVTSDAPRQKYLDAQLLALDANIQDRDLNFWTNNGWVDWTRTFPAGSYYLYGRLSAGNGPFNLQCSLVTSGAGTSSQTTSYLGTFKGTGVSFATWQYVPMVNTNTGLPVAVSLGGVQTLQMTGDNNENANFFMLIPAAAPVAISPSISGSNILLSFPTQSGPTYQMYYKTNLTDPTWTFLSSVVGDGLTKTIPDALGSGNRFYRLSIQ